MTLRSRGAAARVRRHKAAAGVSVTYTRAGSSAVPLTGWLGRTAFASNSAGGPRVEFGDRDYFFAVADMTAAGLGAPRNGDRIAETINGVSVTFENQTPDTGDPDWRYSDPDRSVYRLHCKQITVIPDTTAPTLLSATVSGDGGELVLVFDENVTAVSWTGFALTGTLGAATASYASGTGTTTVRMTTSRQIGASETVTLAYTPGVVKDLSGNSLATFTGRSVQNNSTQVGQLDDALAATFVGRYVASPTYCFTDVAGTIAAADGQAVACWKDSSGNGRHMTQTTAANRPTLRLVSGRWLVRFDGTNDEVNWTGTPTFGNAALGVALALNPSATASDSRDLARLRDLALGDALAVLRIGSKFRGTFSTSAGAPATNSAADFATSPSSAQWVVNSGLAFIHRLNRVEQTGTVTGTTVTRNCNLIQLGLSNGIANWNGDVYEFLVGGSGWNQTNANAIDAYFTAAYGTP